jgi:iduronate 2-sulfatase
VEWHKVGAPPETAQFELYDYQSDPLESQNVAAQMPEVLAELQTILDRYPEPIAP